MRITPLDIQQKQFPMKFRGFDVEEVYAFLEIVREEMEDLLRETLMTAQQMVEEYKTNARKEAELLIREAEIKADGLMKEAQEKVVKIHEDIVDLKGIRRHFKEELKRLIESHMRMLEFDKEREGEEAGGISS